MVINIDGFNEVALSYLNNKAGTDVSMPNDYIYSPLIAWPNKDFSSEQLDLRCKFSTQELSAKYAQPIERVQARHLLYVEVGTSKIFLEISLSWNLQTFSQLKREEERILNLPEKRIEKPFDDPEALERIVDLWFNSSLGMNDLLAARKIPYFEFIQPNQYYQLIDQFSADEKKIAFDEKSQYKEGTIKGYPNLLVK